MTTVKLREFICFALKFLVIAVKTGDDCLSGAKAKKIEICSFVILKQAVENWEDYISDSKIKRNINLMIYNFNDSYWKLKGMLENCQNKGIKMHCFVIFSNSCRKLRLLCQN